MDQITHNVRSAYWQNIINECQNRPDGMSAKKWLENNGIKAKSYYYWLRKFRKQFYDDKNQTLTLTRSNSEISFAEVSYSSQETSSARIICNSSTPVQPVAVIQCSGGSIAVTNEISENMLSLILREALHA